MLIFRKSSPGRFDADYKRPPIRQMNGVNGYDGRGAKAGLNYAKCIRPIGWCLSITLSLVFILSLVGTVLYVNCSSSSVEVIPKSHQLCHDLYQFVQTGRIQPLTWDYKASLNESVHILHSKWISTYEWFHDLHLVDKAIAAAIGCRDAIVNFSIWIYHNVAQKLIWAKKLALGLFDIAKEYVIRAGRSMSKFAVDNFEWIKGLIANSFYDVPAYLEKMKGAVAK